MLRSYYGFTYINYRIKYSNIIDCDYLIKLAQSNTNKEIFNFLTQYKYCKFVTFTEYRKDYIIAVHKDVNLPYTRTDFALMNILEKSKSIKCFNKYVFIR